MALAERGNGPTRIARLLHTTPQSVARWLRAYRQRGADALTARPTPGRPAKLSPHRRQALAAALLEGAAAWGFPTDLWTCPRVAELIERRWDIRYHVDHIPRLLTRLGFSPSEARNSSARAR